MMITCEELVIVDGQVVRQILSKFDVVPQTMLPLISFEEYEKRLKADRRLFKAYSSLKELYEASIERGFKILPDSFGGFGLFNHTEKTLKPSLEPLRPFPVGPIESVPQELQNEMSDLSVMRGELERDELVLLGPIRFANHSCSSNTKFFMGYTSSFLPHNRCIFLQVIKSIEVGEEITLSYGNNYFKDSRLKCRCPHKEKHESYNEILPPTTPREQRLGDISTQSLHASGNSSEIFHSGESFGSNYGASQSSVGTPTDFGSAIKRKFQNQRKRRVKRSLVDSSSRHIQTYIHQVDSVRSSDVETEENSTHGSMPFSADDIMSDPSCEVASIGESSSNRLDIISDHDSEDVVDTEKDCYDHSKDGFQFSSQPLLCNSNVTVHNAALGLFAISARYCLPDEALYDLLKFQKIIHPNDRLPAPNFLKQETKKLTEQYIKHRENNGNGEVIYLNFFDKLVQNVQKYINEIVKYADPETKTDLKLSSLFEEGTIHLKLIINVDGVQVRESSDCSAYPLWVALADLPPKLRSSFDNIFLCSLWYGKGEISWDPIFDHYASEISKLENIEYNERSYQIRFITIFLIVDLVCKHDVLKMKKFNGYYGCGLCTMRGIQRFPGSHSYPNDRTFTMRNPAEHEHLVRLFESGVVDERKGRKEKDPEVDTLGVKGRSKIFDIVPNLPLTCPIDTMHQCLKGVAHDVIKFFAEQLSSIEIAEIDNATEKVRLPSEFKRSIRSLRSLDHFKAKELKTFLLYFSPIVFRKFFESSVAHDTNIQNLDYLAFSLRSMYESVSQASLCGHILEAFCYNMSFRYPLKKYDSINYHFLRHLAWQCATFGPLWTTSATMFENANNHLIRTLTGTVNTCSLIVSRYIRNRQLGSFETKKTI